MGQNHRPEEARFGFVADQEWELKFLNSSCKAILPFVVRFPVSVHRVVKRAGFPSLREKHRPFSRSRTKSSITIVALKQLQQTAASWEAIMTDFRKEMSAVLRTGKPVRARVYRDYSFHRKTIIVGWVIDEVMAIHEADDPTYDIRYSVEKILLTNNEELVYRTMYYRWEGRSRGNRADLRLAYGQFAAILPSHIAQQLNEQMFFKGWEPWTKLEHCVNLD